MLQSPAVNRVHLSSSSRNLQGDGAQEKFKCIGKAWDPQGVEVEEKMKSAGPLRKEAAPEHIYA